MKISHHAKLVLCLLVLFISITFVSDNQLTIRAANDQFVYLPIIIGGTGEPALSDLMRAEIARVLVEQGSELGVTAVSFDTYALTIHFTAPPDAQLLDNYLFEETLKQINNAMSALLVVDGYPQPHQFDYELFVNGRLLSESSVAGTTSLLNRMTGIQDKKIVINPGHGWHETPSGGWQLDRVYQGAIVEDFINAELVMDLYPKLASTNADVRPSRQMDTNAGNHVSGHPWWEMGSSEYIRGLGLPGNVWGSGFSNGYNRNIVTPPLYGNYIGADMLVSIHNNGGGGCGTETWYDNNNGYQDQSYQLATLIQNKVVERLRSQWDANWCDRGVKGSNHGYGEIRYFNGPAVIVELAFMDNQSNNNALQNATFRSIAMTAVRDAIVEYYEGPAPPPPSSTFSGNPSSRLFVDQNGERINLEVCADSIIGQTVYARLSRPGRLFDVVSMVGNGRCVTFWDMDGTGALLDNTPYTTRAALNQPANNSWPVPCFNATGGRGLCDTVSTSSGSTTAFTNGVSTPSIDANAVNLQVCADNLAGKVVYAQMWRDAAQGYPAHTWNYSQFASSGCVTFSDIDGVGGTFTGVDYYIVTAIEPIGSNEAAQQRISCYDTTGHTRLCDKTNRNSGSSNAFVNGVSTPSIDVNAVNLQVCAGNLAGKTVYVQMWRDAAEGYPAHTWNHSQPASGGCVTFSDMDGVGGTFANVDYYTVAAIEPIGSNEAAQQRISCYDTTGHTRLCDKTNRGGSSNAIVNGVSTPSIDANAVNLQVCADNLAGKTVYVQMWRDAAEGYPAHTWNHSQVASSGCVTFNDMDGVGGTFANVDYYTVAAIEPIGSNEAAQQRTSCYYATGHTRLCDKSRR